MTWLVAAVGGAIGTLARHGVNIMFARGLERSGALATATVNILGATVIGLLAGLVASGRLHMTPHVRTFVFVGVLGGFTTFSSYMLDTLVLGIGGDQRLAFANVAGQTLVGLGVVWVAYYVALGQ